MFWKLYPWVQLYFFISSVSQYFLIARLLKLQYFHWSWVISSVIELFLNTTRAVFNYLSNLPGAFVICVISLWVDHFLFTFGSLFSYWLCHIWRLLNIHYMISSISFSTSFIARSIYKRFMLIFSFLACNCLAFVIIKMERPEKLGEFRNANTKMCAFQVDSIFIWMYIYTFIYTYKFMSSGARECV